MTEAGEMNFAKSKNTSALRCSQISSPPLRVAGQSIEEEIRRLSDQLNDRLVLAAVFLVITVLEWYTWWFSLPPNPGLITLVTILVVAFAVRTVFRHRRAMANLKQGLAEKEPSVLHWKNFVSGDTACFTISRARTSISIMSLSVPQGFTL